MTIITGLCRDGLGNLHQKSIKATESCPGLYIVHDVAYRGEVVSLKTWAVMHWSGWAVCEEAKGFQRKQDAAEYAEKIKDLIDWTLDADLATRALQGKRDLLAV